MQYSFLLWGMLFLAFPHITLLDPLPDFIGILLIMKGFAPALTVSSELSEAQGKWKACLRVALIRFFAQPALLFFAGKEKSMMLVLTLAFGICECVFLLPALSSMTEGIVYLATLHAEKKEKICRGWTAFRRFAFFFFVLRAVMNVLPEICTIDIGDDGYVISTADSETSTLAAFRSMLMLLTTVFALIFGVIFFILWIRRLGMLKKDGTFTPLVAEQIRLNPVPQPKLLMNAFRAAKLPVVSGLLFFSSFLLDGYEILPAFVGSFLLLLALARLKPLEGFRKARLPLILSGCFSLAYFVLETVFASRFYEFGLYKDGAKPLFCVCALLAGASALCFLLFLPVCRGGLLRLIETHCGLDVEKDTRLSAQVMREKKRLSRLITVLFIGWGVISLLGVADYLLLFSADPVIRFSEKFSLTIPLWSISSLLTVGFTVFSFRVTDEIYEQIEEKYL